MELNCLEEKIIETINQLAFFDIMIHFPIHLANEVRLEGPHQNGWMYSTKEKWVHSNHTSETDVIQKVAYERHEWKYIV